MKTIILCGGLGTRLGEETEYKPKPMIEIGGKPILWHIMKAYAYYGYKEFALALGYKSEVIKRYFLDYARVNSSLSVRLGSGDVMRHHPCQDDWTIHLMDTGQNTMTGGRILRLKELIGNETFMLTYGDGVTNIDIGKLVEFHKGHGKMATVSGVRPPARFGGLIFEDGRVAEFSEKPQVGEGWINGGYFVLEPEVMSYIEDDATFWERGPLERLASEGQLMAYCHDGFWQCMDTLRDLRTLEGLWSSGNPPWKVWNEPN